MNILDEINDEQIKKLIGDKTIPEFAPGDTVRVNVRVQEGGRSRIQAFEGVCIARSGSGINANFTVRKISYNEGVERVFPLYSPVIEGIEVIRRGKVRRAKLYYLRGRRGKAARIAEKQDWARGAVVDQEAAEAARTQEVEETAAEAVEAAKAEEAEEAEAAQEQDSKTAAQGKSDKAQAKKKKSGKKQENESKVKEKAGGQNESGDGTGKSQSED